MSQIKSSGAKANYNGNSLENFVESALNSKNYRLVSKEVFEKSERFDYPMYAKQVKICKGIYDNDLNCDFCIYHPTKWSGDLIIECKWQQSKGSVDEKYPYLVINIKEKYPSKTIILIDGGGYKPNAEHWLRNQVDEKLIHVLNMSNFQKLCNEGFL